jgi:hypothetical protein
VIILFAGIVIGSAGMYFVINNLPVPAIVNAPIVSFNDLEQLEEKKAVNLLVTNNIRYNLLDTKKSEFGVNGEKPLEGGLFVITELEIENIGKEEMIIYGNSWFVKDSEERVYKPKSHNVNKDNENIFSITIPPGFKVTKKIGFEIPKESDKSIDLFVADSPSKEAKSILFTRII